MLCTVNLFHWIHTMAQGTECDSKRPRVHVIKLRERKKRERGEREERMIEKRKQSEAVYLKGNHVCCYWYIELIIIK